MKFRIVDGNSVICSTSDNEVEIHPLWLRERASEARFLHEHTKQRLYEPSNLILDLSIESAKLKDDVLIVEFSDQEKCQFDLSKLTDEIEKNGKDRYQRDKYNGHDYYDDTVKFCEKYDQISFDPDYESLRLEDFAPYVKRVFGRRPRNSEAVSTRG